MEVIRKVIKQTSWQVFGKALSSLSTILILGLLSRNYGKEGVGLYTLALTYLNFFYLFADLGLNGYVLSRLSEHHEEANKLFNFRLAWGLILGLTSILILPFFPFNSFDFSQAILIGATSVVCFGLLNSFNLIFQKHLNYERSIISSSLGILALTLTTLLLINIKAPVPFLLIGPAVGWIINVMVADILVEKFYKFRVSKLDFKYPFATLKNAWAVSATLLINTVYFRIDTFILSSLKPLADVGIYNLAYSVFQTILVIPTFIMNAFYPKMLKTYEENFKKFTTHIYMATVLMFILGVLVTVSLWISTPLIISVIGGEGFLGSKEVLRILSVSMPAFFLSALYIWVFMTLKRYKVMMIIYIIGFIFNLVLNLKLIPVYSFYGASVVTVLSEYLILVMQMVFLSFLFQTKR
ncbi:MAG: polysaccharide biosynthesis protein [uncultured bacterium]|uniref:Membrane protein involved in the export of O-antigen and teichoic acid n=3 Tax=Candidatus Daviesiibacteriota TaxID=1752718 RepID=A0A0G0HUZ1_9BACT|nr:MAG: polysaccharide biosynthesis protein [uncultured bacterium]KKQ07681.1 MAG: Membrane protein involved in the export of O-antigen and teichoic acid [Candidatus Daviesbacteria bacterium GW2011_GWB1_36_5]KKQ15957.1 MAG: Membrane protein involved in the export of O-antigen and teichoic acid [Candidatus Daviesbacteria bacterium GW2011_GWA1_36_8]OGE33164.1 MAG: hypothetical protein A3C99_00285 [Candidatus Daviesbacteria bacterium RIFCSPHIGHO2_02_FULL_37_9]OGE34981.1 MAG: hypothetical protein A3